MPVFRWTALAAALAMAASAQPPLTTIQDTLYKADGSRFDGYAFVEWKSFDASTGASIPTHSLVVRVAAGELRVQLTPTTASNGAYYQVKFNSDGKIQFTEYWSVPSSSTPLALKDVRLGGPPGTIAAGGVAAAATVVAISDVTGLQAELNNRPLKGPSFNNGRAAVINSSGTIDGASGNVTDCLRVDGTSVSCSGSGGPGFFDNEVPAGTINGTNAVFTLVTTPTPANSLAVYKNGLLQRASIDYTLSTNNITFAASAIPKTGDLLTASYRIGQQTTTVAGAAGGHLTGFYPNPEIANGVISNVSVASAAAISESKLALNYPTHSNSNDPTSSEKAALAGTSGFPSATNKFVTDVDLRLSNARTPTSHGLLNTSHGDTTPGSPVRGDLIVGQGSPGSWTRLPIGAANRCLMSNGSDAVWNTCLFTGFTAGSIPFVDGSGNLAQNNTALFWDATNRRLSVGSNQSLATGYFWDSTNVTGVTSLVIRAGAGQGTTVLQRWVGADGIDLGWVNSDGSIKVKGFETRSTSLGAGFRDLGTPTDPTNKLNGDMWYNTAQQARKTVDAGQVHTQAQVLCNSTGGTTSSNALLGSCYIPQFFLDAGDRIEIHFNYQHTGTASDWNFGVAFGAGTVISKNVNKAETLVAGRADGAIHSTGLIWGSQAYGASVFNFTVSTALAAAIPTSAFSVGFYGAVLTPGADSVKLLNFTVLRYPAIANP